MRLASAPGNATPVSEFNVFIDAEAYALMLGQGELCNHRGLRPSVPGASGLTATSWLTCRTAPPRGNFGARDLASVAVHLDTRGVHLVDLPDAIAIAAAVWPDSPAKSLRHCHCRTEQGYALRAGDLLPVAAVPMRRFRNQLPV